jgi:hypothetical protein
LSFNTTLYFESTPSGDIIMGDLDGVIVISKECEEDFFAGFDAFMEANAQFGKIAGKALASGTPLTKEPALADMFERKYRNPGNECTYATAYTTSPTNRVLFQRLMCRLVWVRCRLQ